MELNPKIGILVREWTCFEVSDYPCNMRSQVAQAGSHELKVSQALSRNVESVICVYIKHERRILSRCLGNLQIWKGVEGGGWWVVNDEANRVNIFKRKHILFIHPISFCPSKSRPGDEREVGVRVR